MQEKEAGTNFVLLCQSRNMVLQFKKAYLHRAIRGVATGGGQGGHGSPTSNSEPSKVQ